MRQITVNASLTRPSNTTTYATGDAVTNSLTSPTVITFNNCVSVNGGSGTIVGATLIDSQNNTTLKGVFELWLFDTTVAPDNDNEAFTPTDAELATLVGVIPFDVSFVGTATSGADGNAVYPASILNFPFAASGSGRDLYGLLVVRNAYAPVSGETFTIRLNIAQD